MAILVLGIIIFLGMHLVRVIAPGFRAGIIESRGKGTWMGLYTIVSLVGLCLIIYGFGQARGETGMLYDPPIFLRHIALLLMLIAFIVLAAGFLPAGRIAVALKHPQVLSIKIWALAHLLANGETSSVLLFGSFLAWAVILRISLKRRERAGEKVLPVFKSARNDVLAVIIGLVAFVLFVWKLHELLIGVQPVVL
ncbi:NnrU family protein [Sinorhizobium meliloti CCNWSX0020]|uniref:NnrU family protein n=2 Tax=Sinorhizobium TaxID=28105 RepID=H0FYW7_RHIML|nr:MULTISPECIES: NnrU family protein [Sinorhizobium]EHK77768.1 NnrU family protein [Sinorhizobium meliloti CCNWSX0020]RVE88764.1 NnrU family protein [Sinorhizobium meliloti]RVG69439.1 NnrU family protein [Sinorhizobium meliloti]RVH27400.1 NnrU family protein [Sinorhizobium meliloti]RVH29900.1 NnrU family protein [Sinorhizobium meliloti]